MSGSKDVDTQIHTNGTNAAIESNKSQGIPSENEKHPEKNLLPTTHSNNSPPGQTDSPNLESNLQHTNAPVPELSFPRTLSLILTLTGAAILNTLSIQALVIILPTISLTLDIPPARQQWLVSAYSLTFGCFLLLWGRLADVYGKRQIFIYGSLWFCICTIICPFIPSEIGFLVVRGLQGLGAAANVPTAIGILGTTFPPGKKKNFAFAMYSAGAPLGSVFGNFLGGVVGQYATWKWVFWILAIMAAVVTVAGWFVIPLPADGGPKEEDVKNAVDWFGGGLITVGLVILLFALTDGNVVGWSKAYIPVLIVLSMVLVGVFVWWQWHLEQKTTRKPLMKVSIFRNLRVSAAMVTMAFFFAAFNNFLIFATYFYQDYKGLDAIHTTIRFIPTGVVGFMTVFATAYLLAWVDVRYICMFGTMCCAISGLLFAVPIPPNTTYWAYGFPAMVLAVFGSDTLFPALLLLTAHALPQEDQAMGGAMVNAVGQIGRAIGLAIGTAIQVAVQESREGSNDAAVSGSPSASKDNPAFLAGLRSAEWFNFALCLVAFVIATVFFRGAGKVGGAKK